MKRNWGYISVIAATFMCALIGCSSAIEMTSHWNDNVVVIDGANGEWGTSMKPLADPPVAIGIRNDEDFLYVCLSTQSPFYQAQIVNGGLTVWFDSTGEQEKTFGVRFPHHGENTPLWNPREPIMTSFPFLEPSFRELAIIGPDGEPELFSIVAAKGIKVKMGVSEHGLVYEMKVPLTLAVGVAGTGITEIGFQTDEQGSDRLQGPTGRASTGTRGGRGGRGRGSAGSPIEGTGRPEILDIWIKVSLSSPRS